MKQLKDRRIPFIILLIIHSCLLFYAFYKAESKKKLFVLLLSNIGAAYLFEYFVFNLFRAYEYKPGFIKTKQLDNTLGAIMSQAIFVPFTSVFISSLKMGWKMKFVFSFYFAAIEKLFIKLGIFKKNWWKTRYTALFIYLYFYMSDFLFNQLKRGTRSVLFFSLFNMLIVVNSNLLYILALKRKLSFGIGRGHTWWEHFALVPLYTIFYTLISALTLQKHSFFRSIVVFLFRMIFDRFLIIKGFIKVRYDNMYAHVGYHLLMKIVAIFFRQLVYENDKTVSQR